jgi:hypothetical protein
VGIVHRAHCERDMRVYGAIALSVALISSAGAQTNEHSAYNTLPGCRDFVAMGSDNPQL